MPKLPRVQAIVLPILRDALPSNVKCGSWVEDIDERDFPLVNVHRSGGHRHNKYPTLLGFPIIELQVFDTVDLPTTENLYEDCLEALYLAQRRQTMTPAGYIHSIQESVGAMQMESPFDDSWMVRGLIHLGIRPRPTK